MSDRPTVHLPMSTVRRITGEDPRGLLRPGWVPCAPPHRGAVVVAAPPPLPDDAHPGWDRLAYAIFEGGDR